MGEGEREEEWAGERGGCWRGGECGVGGGLAGRVVVPGGEDDLCACMPRVVRAGS